MKLASLFAAVFVWAIASSGVGAEPPATNAPPPIGHDAGPGPGVVLDNTTLWRQFHVSGSSHVRTVDGKLERRRVTWNGYMGLTNDFPPTTLFSPLPPADWTGLAMDDSAWPRVRLPQPVLTAPVVYDRTQRMFRPYEKVVVLSRGKFEIKDPAQVQSCTLSLDYWGGVVVYINGEEVARRNLSGEKGDLAAVADDYPLEAFTTPAGKPFLFRGWFASDPNVIPWALRDRKLRDVEIPAARLRKGVNVLAIEVHAAPVHVKGIAYTACGWPPIGLLSARLAVSPAGAAVAHGARPQGIQIWNCAAYDTVTAFDYGNPLDPLRPIVIRAARNGVFSGRLMATSDQPIRGLKVTVTDLAQTPGGGKIPFSAVRVRYAEPAVAAKSWLAPSRFDGLLDVIPPEIPVINVTAETLQVTFYDRPVDRKACSAGAIAPLWFTVRVPRDATLGVYEGRVSIAAEGLKPTAVPLRVSVSEWIVPDPKDFRVQNFLYSSEEAVCQHYGVPRWSDKHFDLIGRIWALLAEANSRQIFANLAVDFYGVGSNPESLVRWIKQPDGSFKHDFTIFDKYLDTVAKAIGKPNNLRLNCWGEIGSGANAWGASTVSVLDPATGKIESMPQPPLGTEESLAFWWPVFSEVLKKLEARGWLEVTTLGNNSYRAVPPPAIVDVAYKLWSKGEWSHTSHLGSRGMKFACTDKAITMPVRHVETTRAQNQPRARGYNALEKPRPETFIDDYRSVMDENQPLTDLRRMLEDMVRSDYDGTGDFGADLFPLKKPAGGYFVLMAGRGTNWANPGRSTVALLAPGPDGPIATERFEMFREGVELAEALLFVERAIAEKKLSEDLLNRANACLDERGKSFVNSWFGMRHMPAEDDGKLLDLAGEVARELRK